METNIIRTVAELSQFMATVLNKIADHLQTPSSQLQRTFGHTHLQHARPRAKSGQLSRKNPPDRPKKQSTLIGEI